jgi:hypothetical protein
MKIISEKMKKEQDELIDNINSKMKDLEIQLNQLKHSQNEQRSFE